jgi:hypothetical protein
MKDPHGHRAGLRPRQLALADSVSHDAGGSLSAAGWSRAGESEPHPDAAAANSRAAGNVRIRAKGKRGLLAAHALIQAHPALTAHSGCIGYATKPLLNRFCLGGSLPLLVDEVPAHGNEIHTPPDNTVPPRL